MYPLKQLGIHFLSLEVRLKLHLVVLLGRLLFLFLLNVPANGVHPVHVQQVELLPDLVHVFG